MHEMALAEGILDIVLSYADKNEAKKVTEISSFSWRNDRCCR